MTLAVEVDDVFRVYATDEGTAAALQERMAFNRSPWDRFLAGDDRALTDLQLTGAKGFMSAPCSICHNGAAFSDNLFHNVALAQLGPGEGDGAGGHDDFGRMRVTGNAAEQYAFRTTPLRNVELTGRWGHAGQFTTLRAFVDHYSESDVKLRNFYTSCNSRHCCGARCYPPPTLSSLPATPCSLEWRSRPGGGCGHRIPHGAH